MKKIYLNTLTPEEIIKRLKNGAFVKYDGDDEDPIEARLIDGMIVKKYLARGKSVFEISSGIYVDESDDYYFEEQEELKIEKTGLYRTRDGRTAYVSVLLDGDYKYTAIGILEGKNESSSWTLDGAYCVGEESGEDLVEYLGD